MTREELRARYPPHNQTSLAKGFIPPPTKRRYNVWPIVHVVGYWLVLSVSLLMIGAAFAAVILAWLQGA